MMLKRLVKLCRVVSRPYFSKALLKGVAASTEHLDVLRSLACNFVVDIGANRGQFALAARYRFPHARIISFEPLREPAALYRRVLQADRDAVLHECAIGPQEKEMIIHVSRADDSSSLLPISSMQEKLFPGTGEKETRSIPVKPLEAVLSAADIQQPALLKLDVQGFELQALAGCLSLLSLFSHVYVECSFLELYDGQCLAHEVISFLDGHGFSLAGIYNLDYDRQGIAVQGDFLFRKKLSSNTQERTGEP